MLASIWRSTSARSAVASISPSRNGVTSAVSTPSNIAAPTLMVFARLRLAARNLRLDLDHAGEDLGRGAGHLHVRVVRGPGDLEHAAAQLDLHRAVDHSSQHGYHGHRARTAPTGERLARAAFPGALGNAPPVAHQRELDIDAVGERGMVLDDAPPALDRGGIRVVDVDHG